jgi:hypothetical protein
MLDRFGMIASCACAIHCAVVPILLGVLPLVGVAVLGDERLELLMLGVAICIGVASLLPAYIRHHRRSLPLLTFTAGLALVIIAHLAVKETGLPHTMFVVAGGFIISVAHFLNRRFCQKCCAKY